MFLDILAIKYSPNDTAGPIPKAKITVPIPMVPPRDQPIEITVNSKKTLTHAIGKPVTLWQPVINPSLGPGPRFAIRYIPLARPTNNVPSTTCINVHWILLWMREVR